MRTYVTVETTGISKSTLSVRTHPSPDYRFIYVLNLIHYSKALCIKLFFDLVYTSAYIIWYVIIFLALSIYDKNIAIKVEPTFSRSGKDLRDPYYIGIILFFVVKKNIYISIRLYV